MTTTSPTHPGSSGERVAQDRARGARMRQRPSCSASAWTGRTSGRAGPTPISTQRGSRCGAEARCVDTRDPASRPAILRGAIPTGLLPERPAVHDPRREPAPGPRRSRLGDHRAAAGRGHGAPPRNGRQRRSGWPTTSTATTSTRSVTASGVVVWAEIPLVNEVNTTDAFARHDPPAAHRTDPPELSTTRRS